MNKQDFSVSACPQCQVQLSEPIQEDHIKLYRDAIRFGDGQSQFPLESFSIILMHRILDTIDNHSTFHFILKAVGRDKVYLRPINWNLRVYTADLTVGGGWKPAFKLGYARVTEASHTDAEIIHCTPAQYDQIVQLLDEMHIKALFDSTVKIAGSETLKLSYLINI